MADAMRILECDLHQRLMDELRLPAEWHDIAREKCQSKKVRVAMRLDEEIVKFFRATGVDWQPWLNRVLSVWMHARLAGMIRGGETMDYMKRRVEEGFDGPRPRWGDLQRMEEEAFGDGATPSGEVRVPMAVERVPLAVLRGQ